MALAAERQVGFFWGTPVFLLFVIGALLGPTPRSAQAMTFNLTFDASTAAAPAGFFTAFNNAIQFYETNFTSPITINLQVGWGEVNGQALTPGFLGESQAGQPGFFHYDTIKAALVSHAKSAADLTSIANMPASDPTNNATFKVSRAQSKALGFMAGDAAGVDGSVGFDKTASYTFDPNNRAVSGKVDFIGLAGHEITEVMGRFGLGQNGASSGRYGPIDLFRYSWLGVLDLVPENGEYFSIDGGTTVINTFNGTGGGDLSDWAGATFDSYNASLSSGVKLAASAGDIIVDGCYRLRPVGAGRFQSRWPGECPDIPAMLAALTDLNAYQTTKNLTGLQLVLLGDLNSDGSVTNTDIQTLLDLVANNGGGSARRSPRAEHSNLGGAGTGVYRRPLACQASVINSLWSDASGAKLPSFESCRLRRQSCQCLDVDRQRAASGFTDRAAPPTTQYS